VAFWGKVVTAVIGAGAILMALAEVRVIFWFVLFAWSGLACAFTPVVLCSLFWKRTTLAGAVAGMAGGFVTTIVWVLVFKEGFYDLYEMIPGFVAGLLLTVLVSLRSDPPAGAAREMAAIHASTGGPFRAPSRGA
jgi:sodium/proline symporter